MAKAQELVLNLVEMIESRALREGQRLPSERELCERFGSARNTVRRALSILEDERRVVRQPGRRGYVVDERRALFGPSLARSAEAGPADIMELRLIAEPSAAAIAAVRASSADLDAIERAAMRIAASKTIAERENSDAEFHLAVFRATRNPMLVSLCLSINSVRENESWIDNKRRILSEERQCEFDAQHFAVVAALRRRSPDEAHAAMRSHIDSLRRELLGDLLV
jgi:DNA-binding FadR family transcriptional regulator